MPPRWRTFCGVSFGLIAPDWRCPTVVRLSPNRGHILRRFKCNEGPRADIASETKPPAEAVYFNAAEIVEKVVLR